eukprot:maker-scaffold670_size114954-snap-gene-0.19 protein:Tk01661 transcript:maker-scaffold670_size114954-snap-gene-0.19-mRNA-1 annotation:"dual specificity mitogen-activated protein kinase kinase 5-like"
MGLVIGKVGYAIAAVVPPRLTVNEAQSKANQTIQVAMNDVARTIAGKKRKNHLRIPDLLHMAGLPSINELSVRAVAVEAWKGFHSSDGNGGKRNPIGRIHVVHNIDEPTVYIKYLTMLGQKHVMYEAEPQYLNQMGFMFLSAIQPLLEKEAGLSSLNELTVHAVAMETWRAFNSQDGPDGSRNALGQVLFPSNVDTRSTRSETAGVVSQHLPYAANTLVDNRIAMWNKFPALREASTKRMASNVAKLWRIVSRTAAKPVDAGERERFGLRRDRALAIVVLAVDIKLLYLLVDPSEPREVWLKLADQFQKRTWAKRLDLKRKLMACRLEPDDVKKMTEFFEELAVVGSPVDEEDRVA